MMINVRDLKEPQDLRLLSISPETRQAAVYRIA